MSTRSRPAPGGGIVVEIPPERVVGWINRFAGRNDGIDEITGDDNALALAGGDGTTASIAVPFPPMALGHREPVEALLDHIASLGTVGLILVRGGAHSIGIAREGVVLASSTDRKYLQGRTAAGGWSQQRYARRRGNQLTFSLEHAASLAARVLLDGPPIDALVVAGDSGAITTVLADRRLAPLLPLPRRTFGDIPEPRRAVLDDIAARSLHVEITVRGPGAGPGVG
ncbi:hypothetical protein GIS00_07450 [Nakamurella sp. YIM 132087]|uniref:Actinobacteria/chloroflexi VLRF1 release factor domain-containing protein n=1 Tax=Nakamurella alba TaxID=2665158 RepID=A0A7K1FI56_9ACTN|nr:acVLRF1 family peptidyl-tRNA hydrolase [Nakamurella alba]MTD13778.1 hypothetical protein [Nakamurella alba]